MNANGGIVIGGRLQWLCAIIHKYVIVIEGCLQWQCAIIHRSFPHDLDIAVHSTNYKYHSNHHLGVSCL